MHVSNTQAMEECSHLFTPTNNKALFIHFQWKVVQELYGISISCAYALISDPILALRVLKF